MKKRIVGILLTLCMALCLMPTAAFAGMFEEVEPIDPIIGDLTTINYDISVNGVDVTNKNQSDILGDGKVSFEYDFANSKGTLTLNAVNLVCNDLDDDYPIYAPDIENLEIVLKGENNIEAEWLAGIMAANLTFSGSGSIEISTDGNYNWPVLCDNTFTVNGGNVKISSIDYALCLDGALTVNGGTLELIASGEGGYAIDIGRNELNVVLADDRIMITGTNPDGTDARVTAVSEEDTIRDARYVKIFNKYIPITYNPGQYGTGDAVTQNKTYGEDFALADALFTRTGYRQTAWTTAENGGETLRLGSAYSGNGALTLYPVWEPEQYDITYNLGGGTVTGNPEHYTVESESFTLQNPERDGGYEFAGWSGTGLTGTDNKTVTVAKGSTGDREYTAHWRDMQAPVVNGLQDGKTYCSAVEFTATDNDGIASVTANGTPLPEENGKYTLPPAQGKQTVVVKDRAGNRTELTVTVNDGHTGEATCTESAVCEICGERYGEPNPNNHTDLRHVDAKAATKTDEGNIEYWYCEGCGRYFADKDATKEISKEATVTAKLPDGNKPQTGDHSGLAVWIGLLLVSGAGIFMTVCGRKKKHSTK